ncbi:Uncharacterised protein [uncultured archaeon]|nr:Uncharacterised protein [uncultured archaeon]
MKEVGIIRRAGAAFLMLLLLAGLSGAVETTMNPDHYVLRHTNDFQQDVSGEGYVMVYQDVNTNNLSLKNYLHGSGTIDMATLINSEQKKQRSNEKIASGKGWYNPTTKKYEVYDPYIYSDDSVITLTEQNEMSYAPEAFDMATGWYATHPLEYNSQLKEKTDARNYQAGTSMEHQIEYARAFKKDIGITLNCTGPMVGTSSAADGVGLTNMKIEEEVIHGMIHISETSKKPQYPNINYAAKGSTLSRNTRDTLIDVDENYVGSFKIKKNMKVNVPKAYILESSDWLPCCDAGFFDMSTWEQRYRSSAKGIFDCTCRETALKTYQPAWNATMAQFPTKDYQYKA